MLSLTIKNGKKVLYKGQGEGVVDIILAISQWSRDDDFYIAVRRAVFLMEEDEWHASKSVRDMKKELEIL